MEVLRAAFDGRRRISVRGPVSFLPVAGGQVLSRAFLPQGWGEQQGAGVQHALSFCLVFQGAILTTMLATRNFSGRCCLWD